jgi:hypothetical protein
MRVSEGRNDDDSVLKALSLQRFRPFKTEVTLADLSKVNILAGPNNVGKSAMMLALRRLTRLDERLVPLRGLRDGLAIVGGVPHVLWHPNDRQQGAEGPLLRLRFRERSEYAVVDQHGSMLWPNNTSAQQEIERFAARLVFVPPNRTKGRAAERHDPTAYEERRYSGEDVFADLLRWFLPARTGGHVGGRVSDVSAFASAVLGERIEVWPAIEPMTVMVRVADGEPRSWEDLGDGIAQVIVIAMALASVEEPILLLEEPEIGLHPRVQRALVWALAERRGTMSFVTTHSNHILDVDHPHVRVFGLACSEDGGRTVRALSGGDLSLLADLGIRPSSVAQANAVIWVEGPSDVIYLRRWLALKATKFIEGIDYTFAMFGGALLHHTQWSDEDAEKLVTLLRIHPNSFLVADSDRERPDADLGKSYLARVAGKVPPERIWITTNREVEGYVSRCALCAAFDLPGPDQDNLGVCLRERLALFGIAQRWAEEKVALARRVIPHIQSSEIPAGVNHLVRFIEASVASVLPA